MTAVIVDDPWDLDPLGMNRNHIRLAAFAGGCALIFVSTVAFAAFSDTARTGPARIDSTALASSAELKLALGFVDQETPAGVECGTFADNSSTEAVINEGARPGTSRERMWCLRNDGIQTVALNLGISDLFNREVGCTGDEPELDTTCGPGEGGVQQPGELADVLTVSVRTVECATLREAIAFSNAALLSLQTPKSLATSLAPNETICLRVITDYPSSTPITSAIKAQSDRTGFRYVFGGAVPR